MRKKGLIHDVIVVGRDEILEIFQYKKNPSSEQAKTLSTEFDTLFATKTGYDNLDERVIKSKAKKGELLTVLKYPESYFPTRSL